MTSYRPGWSKIALAVKRRDNFTCVKCGFKSTGELIHAAHKIARVYGGPDSMENVITLCVVCHRYQPDGPDEQEELVVYLSDPLDPNMRTMIEIAIIGAHAAREGRTDEEIRFSFTRISRAIKKDYEDKNL